MIISTPAKIILSGEHSVVYGAPAIGAPLSLFLYTRWSEKDRGEGISFHFRGEEARLAPSWEALPLMLAQYRARYDAFKKGAIPIAQVLPAPQDLATLTIAAFHEKFAPDLAGLSLSVETEIPMSSGLGSSSALICNLLKGLLHLAGRDVPQKDILAFARDIEDFQHGYSSGIDLALVSAKQPLVFVKDKGVIGAVPSIPSGIVLVNTGKPAVSTGDCVAKVRQGFANDNALWSAFAACTVQIQTAFTNGDAASLKDGVFENAKLLDKIGVVPDRVRGFIADLKARGIPAKVCGAGAVAGDAAGMVWALADDDRAAADLKTIVEQYGYHHGLYAVAG